jgi:hypothetical protein
VLAVLLVLQLLSHTAACCAGYVPQAINLLFHACMRAQFEVC